MRIHSSFLISLLGVVFLGNATSAALLQKTPDQADAPSQEKTCPLEPCAPAGEVGVLSPSSSPGTNNLPDDDSENSETPLKKVFVNLPGDQKAIWTSTLHHPASDGWSLPPIVETTGLLVSSERQNIMQERYGADAIQVSNSGSNGDSQDQTAEQENTLGVRYLKNLFSDQKAIWTSPAQIRPSHLPWLIPFVSISGGLFATDSNVAKQLSQNPSLISNSRNLANAGVATLVAGGLTFYLYGRAKEDDHARETGVLSSEAAINSVAVAELIKLATGRERPSQDVRGRFFQGGKSFPSEHSMVAWSIASVAAHEFPRPLFQAAAYGIASAVSISRITSRDHFPSDIFIGSVAGYLIGRQVYAAHHSPDLPGSSIGTFTKDKDEFGLRASGTTYVPLDSWVYPALDRLAALGFLRTDIPSLRPWTRSECARLVQEAGEQAEITSAGEGINTTYQALQREFSPEIEGVDKVSDSRIEEIYARAGGLSGQPLADDYHFAKTIVDDFGRPFGNGVNFVTGVSSRTVAGPFAIYVRGEDQHAGTLPAESASTLQAIAHGDGTPFAVPNRTGSLDRFRFLESYVSLTFHNNVISFGKQALWWGPGADSPFLFSTNAEPLPLLRLSRATPILLPWIFRYLGPLRLEAVWGQLNGHQFVTLQDANGENLRLITPPISPHPYLHGEKFSFKPTRNFEFAFGLTTLFGGPGFPLTLGNLARTYTPGNAAAGAPKDPGDRRSAFDFSYRLPGVRNWLTLYGDSFTEDEFSPVSYPRKSSFRGGLFMPRLPKLHAVDMRVEGVFTDIPNLDFGTDAGVEYFNFRFRNGYTNFGQIIGSWIGREGRGVTALATYHLSAQSNIQLHYRNQKVNPLFIQGGHLQDFGASATFFRAGGVVFGGSAQYEHWAFPALSPTPKSNVYAAFEIRYQPIQGLKLW
jgi:membrane-associated phospholipid phosphatase